MIASTAEFATEAADIRVGVAARIRRLFDEMSSFYVIAAVLLLAIVVPAWQAAQPTPVVERVVEEPVQTSSAAKKGDRLRNTEVDLACSNATYGNESAECLVAIAKQSGRTQVGDVRIVGFGEAGNG